MSRQADMRGMYERSGRKEVARKVMEVIDALTGVKDTTKINDEQILDIIRNYCLQQIESAEREAQL